MEKEKQKDIERGCYLIDKLDSKLFNFCQKYKVKPEEAISKLKEIYDSFVKIEAN